MTAVFKSQWPLEIQIQILDRMCLARVSHYLFMDHFSEMHSLHSTLTSAHNLNNLSHSLSLPTDHSINPADPFEGRRARVLFDPATSGNSRPVFRNSHFSLTNRTRDSAKWMRLKMNDKMVSFKIRVMALQLSKCNFKNTFSAVRYYFNSAIMTAVQSNQL